MDQNEINKSYDIIVVGGGTAGCVIAARLSEIESLRVLLLEAGGNHNDDPRVKTPMLMGQSMGDPGLDWNHHAIPQKEIHDKTTLHPRGKGLGGSSLINYMSLQIASKSTYDAWENAGNPGWGWDGLLPYLRKSQHYNPPSKTIADAFSLDNIDSSRYGRDGPVQWSHAHEVHPIEKAWLDTFHNLGQLMCEDPMSGLAAGAFSVTSAVDASRERSHSAVAYLEAAKGRPNLAIVSDATVERILFAGKRVKGIVYSISGQEHNVEAKKEVVLCCGAFESPALLERSGIGRADILQQLGVSAVHINENVGENLQDHMFAACSFEVDPQFETLDDFRDPKHIENALDQYQKHRKGPMAANFSSVAHLPLRIENSDLDIEGILKSCTGPRTPALHSAEELVRKMLQNQKEGSVAYVLGLGQAHMEHTDTFQNIIGPSTPGKYITIYVAIGHPLSRSSVHARSMTVGDIVINPRYYTHSLDVALTARRVKYFDTIVNTGPLKSMLVPNGRRIPEWASFDSLEETEKLLRYSNMSFYHPVGSCSMLPEIKDGVVDSRLRVYGIDGLRVCDASIMPVIPRGPIMSSVYALAEKGADLIKEDFGVLRTGSG